MRRSVESSQASAQASAGDLQTARLSLQAELAQDYPQLRTLDAQQRLIQTTVAAYERALTLTRTRQAAGVASSLDVAQAEAQLTATEAQYVDVGVQRAQLEHAVALLAGEPASTFSGRRRAPRRRGQRADRRRRRAFYPSITLSASAGFESSGLGRWLTWPSRFWSVGPGISQTLFDGGLRRAQTAGARAAYDASVAHYRQAVLGAFQNVEDNLAALRILEDEARLQDEAVAAATQSVTLTTEQYRAGTVSYLNVITAQTIALANQVTGVQILGRTADRRGAARPGAGRRLARPRSSVAAGGDP